MQTARKTRRTVLRPLRRLAGLKAAILSLVATLSLAGPSLADSAGFSGVSVRIMTQNMYQGTNFERILRAKTPEEFVAAVTATYRDVLATRPRERAASIARTIARERPDIVALLETTILRTGSPPATDVESDQLIAVLAELRRLGLPYEAIAILPGTDTEAPTLLGKDVRITDRTAIIVPSSPVFDAFRVSNMQVQDYIANSPIVLPVGPPAISRAGWASVDLTVRGRTFRFATTHLEVIPPFAIQRAQALEAIKSVGNTALPLVFVGDFNTVAGNPKHPTFPTYKMFIDAGFVDAWKTKYPSLPGFTCCQASNLKNPVSALTMRIDLVLTRGPVSVDAIKLVGNLPGDRTASGLWPSDHAGLVATVRLTASR